MLNSMVTRAFRAEGAASMSVLEQEGTSSQDSELTRLP